MDSGKNELNVLLSISEQFSIVDFVPKIESGFERMN